MRQSVGEMRGQRGLRIAMNARFEPGGAARFRIAAVGADGEPGGDQASIFKARSDGVGAEIVSLDPCRDALDAGDLRGAGRERLGHSVVFDIPAKGVEPDLRRAELDRTGRKQRSAVVDEAQSPQWRGLRLQSRPQAEGFQKTDRLVEQRDGASAARSLGRAATDDAETRLREAKGCRQPRKPRACNQDVRAASRRLIAVGHRSVSPHASLAIARWLSLRPGRRRRATLIRRSSIRSSRRRIRRESAERRTGQGMSIEKRPVDVASAAGFSVHLFTASGGAVAVLALYAAIERNFATSFAWLGLALFIDGIDGTLARAAKVQITAASIDGTVLDLVVDFLTYVLVPVIALWRSDLMPTQASFWIGLVVTIASALYFADTRMKTDDLWFRGFPATWNIVVLYLFVLRPPWVISALILLGAAALMFTPVVFVHPLRVVRLRELDHRDDNRLVRVGRARDLSRTWRLSAWVGWGLIVTAAYFLGLPFLRHSPAGGA